MGDKFALGQWVMVKAQVITARQQSNNPREYNGKGDYFYLDPHEWNAVYIPNCPPIRTCLLRRELTKPLRMLVIGKTYRATGEFKISLNWEEPGYLKEDKRHSVYMLRNELRWSEPFLALAEDMEIVDDR
jgi:hypothetical protein